MSEPLKGKVAVVTGASRGIGAATALALGRAGARIVATLLHTMKDQGKKRGLATLCIGGGEALAVVVER